MKYLLDTHILIWWLQNDSKINQCLSIINNSKNHIYISTINIWEIIIKQSLGKLKIPKELDDIFTINQFLPLDINYKHTMALKFLPPIHQDPFDRMLIAQAIVENLTLITSDKNIKKYPVKTL